MFTKILVPLDGSGLAEAVLPHVERLAIADNAQVVLLAVVVPVRLYTDAAINYPIDEDQQVSEAEQYLKAVAARLGELGLRTESVVRYGGAADEILAFAKETGADLIAMSTHGRSGLGRWVFGSVADKVLRAARIPLLVFRPPATHTS